MLTHRLLWFAALWAAVLGLASSAPPAFGHSGQVALAHPAGSILVDGDFSDWPATAEIYPLAQIEHGTAPRDAADLRASFRLA